MQTPNQQPEQLERSVFSIIADRLTLLGLFNATIYYALDMKVIGIARILILLLIILTILLFSDIFKDLKKIEKKNRDNTAFAVYILLMLIESIIMMYFIVVNLKILSFAISGLLFFALFLSPVFISYRYILPNPKFSLPVQIFIVSGISIISCILAIIVVREFSWIIDNFANFIYNTLHSFISIFNFKIEGE